MGAVFRSAKQQGALGSIVCSKLYVVYAANPDKYVSIAMKYIINTWINRETREMNTFESRFQEGIGPGEDSQESVSRSVRR